jgi:hypothetical protein
MPLVIAVPIMLLCVAASSVVLAKVVMVSVEEDLNER